MSASRCCLLSAILLLAPAWSGAAGEAAAAKPAARPRGKSRKPGKGEAITVKFHARDIRALKKEDAILLSGSAWAACRGMLLEAENIVVFPKKKQAYAEGAVRLTEKGGRLLAEEIFYDFRLHRGRARGVRLEIGRIETVPARAKPGGAAPAAGPAPEGAWSVGFGRATPRKWYLSAPEIRRAGPGRWILVRPSISSCEFQKPHWRFRASSANYLPGRRVESFNNVLFLGPVPVLYLPYVVRDLAHDYPWTTWQFGNSSRWGPYVLSKWGLDLPRDRDWVLQPENLLFDFDWRRDRGLAYGVDLRYDALPHGGGRIDTYFLREDHISGQEDRERAEDEIERRSAIYDSLHAWGAPKVRGRPKRIYPENRLFAERRARAGFKAPDLSPDLYASHHRFRLAASHRQDLFLLRNDLQDDAVYALDFSVEYSDHSDRDFRREYFREEYRSGPPPVSYAMLRQQTDVFSAAVLVQPRLDRFESQTEYLPELRFDVPPRSLPAGLLLATGGSVGHLYRRFDRESGFSNFDAGRAHLRAVASRPLKLGPVAFNPYAGTDQTWYSDHRDGGDLARGALLYGADSSVRFYGRYAAGSEKLNIHGLRHVVEPRIFYRGVSEPTHTPAKLYDFDSVDDLYETNVAGAGLSQKLQARRRNPDGSHRVVDLAGVDFSARGFVDRVEAGRFNHGDMLLPMEVKGFLRPSDHLRLWNHLEIDAHGAGLTGSASGLELSWSERFSVAVSHRTVTEDTGRDIQGSQYLSARLDVVLSEHWRTSLSGRYEFDEPDRDLGEQGLDNARVTLIRDLHCWQAGLSFSIERRDDRRNRVLGFTISPKGRPRNLVKASDQLLLDDPDYSRMPWVARPGEAAGALRLLPPKKDPAAEPEKEEVPGEQRKD